VASFGPVPAFSSIRLGSARSAAPVVLGRKARFLCVDENEERRTVRLPEGISAGLQWVRLALVLTVTSSAT
jgi:hypothetical protein